MLSIIIPVYNAASYLERCLDSVFNQSLTDFEVICVNDGSTDSSLELLMRYRSKHPEMIVIDRENGGQSIARNEALDRAAGEYIAFLDSDDYWFEGRIGTALQKIALEKLDMYGFNTVYSDFKMHYRFQEAFNEQVFPGSTYLKKASLELPLTVWAFLFRKEFIDRFNIRFKENSFYEDVLFVYQSLCYASRVKFNAYETVVCYTLNPDSTTGKRSFRTVRDFHYILVACARFFQQNRLWNEAVKERLFNSVLYNTRRAIEFGFQDQYNALIHSQREFLSSLVSTEHHKKAFRLLCLNLNLYEYRYLSDSFSARVFRLFGQITKLY